MTPPDSTSALVALGFNTAEDGAYVAPSGASSLRTPPSRLRASARTPCVSVRSVMLEGGGSFEAREAEARFRIRDDTTPNAHFDLRSVYNLTPGGGGGRSV